MSSSNLGVISNGVQFWRPPMHEGCIHDACTVYTFQDYLNFALYLGAPIA